MPSQAAQKQYNSHRIVRGRFKHMKYPQSYKIGQPGQPFPERHIFLNIALCCLCANSNLRHQVVLCKS